MILDSALLSAMPKDAQRAAIEAFVAALGLTDEVTGPHFVLPSGVGLRLTGYHSPRPMSENASPDYLNVAFTDGRVLNYKVVGP